MKTVYIKHVFFILFLYLKTGKTRKLTHQTECGKLNSENLPPWNVGIYEENPKNKNLNLVCFGTAILEDAIITGKVLDVDMNNIFIHNSFEGILKNSVGDLALLKCSEKLKTKTACVDWADLENDLKSSDTGIMSVWQGQDAFVKVTPLSYIDFDYCYYSVSEDFASRITRDKFCMKSEGAAFQSESIGSGLTSQSDVDGLWYIKGVLSLKADGLAIFTSLKSHMNWISNTCAQL